MSGMTVTLVVCSVPITELAHSQQFADGLTEDPEDAG